MGFSAESALTVATKIGRDLCNAAIWDGEQCTWEVVTAASSKPFERKSKRTLADGSLYQGTAGIALFLGELCNIVGDLTLLKTARGAIAHASAYAFPATFSFHNGVIGTAYVLNRLQQLGVVGNRWDQIDALLQPLIDKKDDGIDVIAGAAGAIPVLLQLASDAPERDYLQQMARQLGDQLIESARREPVGWSWGTGSNHVRNLLGMAHGTAGIGLALYELFYATGETRYQFAAESAIQYEQNLYDPNCQNWPDFRYAELGEYTFNNQLDTLRTRLRTQTLPAFTPQSMSAWCHGAPGVGLSRLRLYALSGEQRWRSQAVDALNATRQSLHHPLSNYSQCHGMSGNAETLLHAARMLDEPRWLGTVNAVAAFGKMCYHDADSAWPCGTVGGKEDPSLMLGLAGIGLFYLRLADADVPSPLLIEVPHKHDDLIDNADTLRLEQLEAYFGRTLAALPTPYQLPKRDTLHTDLQLAYQSLTAKANEHPAVCEAGKVDFAHYEMMLAMTDLTADWLRQLGRESADAIAWDSATFILAPEVRLIETAWNSDQNCLDEQPHYFLLHRTRNQIARRQIQPFLYVLLTELAQPKGVTQLVSHFSEMIASDAQRPLLQRKVVQQLQQLYKAGIIQTEEAASSQPQKES